jgi:ribosomal protein L11 methylase PrmA
LGSRKGSAKLKGSRLTLVELAKKVDLRLEFLDPSWFRSKRVLDIGCNSALLTVFIGKAVSAIFAYITLSILVA